MEDLAEDMPFDLDALVIRAPMATAAPEGRPGVPHAERDPGSPSGEDGVCRAPESPPNRPPAPTPMPMANEPERAREHWRLNPLRPQTPEAIAAFTGLWRDTSRTLADISRRYGCHGRTLQKWASDLGLGPRVGETGSGPAPARSPGSRSWTPPSLDPGPAAEPLIRAALDEITQEGLAMTAHSDLTGLHRKVLRLAILAAAKAPAHSWPGLQVVIEGLTRALLSTRRAEARMPPGRPDQAVLRREAAGQLMRELKSVLSPQEQNELARLVKLGADRLVAGHGQSRPATTSGS